MKRSGHDSERSFQPFPRQADEIAAIGKARSVHDRIDGAERGARRTHQVGSRPRAGKTARAPFDVGACLLALRSDRLQPLEPGGIRSLSMQHQAPFRARQAPRDRGSDPGPAACYDRDPHEGLVLKRSHQARTIGSAAMNANEGSNEGQFSSS